MPFDPRSYWEDRLRDCSLAAVGHRAASSQLNRWMYRVRRHVFLQVIRRRDVRLERILDVGSGSGFYINCWKEVGVSRIEASDFTEKAIKYLSEAYPDIGLHHLDIATEELPPELEGAFDAVSAMDVLFHVLDEDSFQEALENVKRILKPRGLFIWSDNFLRHPSRSRMNHVSHRSLETTKERLREVGFEVIDRRPLLYWLNQPIDSESRMRQRIWTGITRLSQLHPIAGHLIGAILYPVEILSVKLFPESPTTELMVCIKIR